MNHRHAILGVAAVIVGLQATIWVLLAPLSMAYAAAASTALALALVKFGTTGPRVNFLTPAAIRRDDLFFLHCVEKGVNPGIIRRAYRYLPSDPRCRLCLFPFRGVGTLLRVEPSGKNPNFCQSCIEYAPFGVCEMEVGILFADVRGYTAWSERHTAREAAERMSAFYRVANRVFTGDDAFVEFIGDQVMVIYIVAFPSLAERTPAIMIAAAQRFQAAAQRQLPGDDTGGFPVGIGIHLGVGSVGNVGDRYAKDFTALGDVVNTASRLQGVTRAGEILVSEAAYTPVAGTYPDAKAQVFDLKGKAEPVRARILGDA